MRKNGKIAEKVAIGREKTRQECFSILSEYCKILLDYWRIVSEYWSAGKCSAVCAAVDGGERRKGFGKIFGQMFCFSGEFCYLCSRKQVINHSKVGGLLNMIRTDSVISQMVSIRSPRIQAVV